MAQIVFRSKYARLCVHFDPSRFERISDPNGEQYARDAQGNLVTVLVPDPLHPGATISTPVERKIAQPPAQFDSSMLVLDDNKPMQKIQAEGLRAFITGKVRTKSGEMCFRPDELWEEDSHTTDIISQLNGTVLITLPKEFSPEDIQLLKGLENYFHNAIPRPALSSATAMLEEALGKFKVRGILSPVAERAVKQLRPRIIELVYAIQDTCDQLQMESPFDLEPRLRPGSDASAQLPA